MKDGVYEATALQQKVAPIISQTEKKWNEIFKI